MTKISPLCEQFSYIAPRFDVKLVDHPHLSVEEIARAEKTAQDYLNTHTDEMLMIYYRAHQKLLREGSEKIGETDWTQIEDLAYKAALSALHAEKWHRIPEEMHIEITVF